MLFRLLIFSLLLFVVACGSPQNSNGVDARPVNDSTVACSASFIYLESYCDAEQKHIDKDLQPLSECRLALVNASRHDTLRIATNPKGIAQFRVKPGVYGIYLSRPANSN